MLRLTKSTRTLTEIQDLLCEFEVTPTSKKFEDTRLKKITLDFLWYLNTGQIRVFDLENKKVRTWVKVGILQCMRLLKMHPMKSGVFEFSDKLAVKSRKELKGIRVVPGAIARTGSYIEPGCVLMPSFINIGAYVGKGTMVDTWATVGSCAQIGENVHLSGGVGIGGVLEPVQAKPVVIENGAFIGSRAIIVEGVHVGAEAVIGAGVVLTATTKIIDVRGKDAVYSKGYIPERAVVIPGVDQKEFSAGTFGVPCALIIGTRNSATDLKVSLNEALRNHEIAI